MRYRSMRFIIASFVLGLVWTQVAHAQTTTVTFDSPPPPWDIRGVFQGIDFGIGQWAGSGPYYVNPSNHIYFADSNGTSRTFRFSPAPRVLNSARVYTVTPGVLTLSDDAGQTLTREVTTGSQQLVTTGWTRPSTTVTVSFTSGWDLGVDEITSSDAAPWAGGEPNVRSLSPNSAIAGGAPFTLTVTGANFVTSSVVRWNGAARPTTFVSRTQLTAAITAADIATPGTARVTVFTPEPEEDSEGLPFTIAAGPNPAPVVSGLSPDTVVAGSPAFTVTVTGSGFVSASVILWNGSDRPTTVVSSTSLQAAISASDVAVPGTASVTVFTPAPGGGASVALPFTISMAPNPVPEISGLSPSAVTAGSPAFTLTVTGSGFVGASVVLWNGSDRPTTVVSSTRLQAAISASDVALPGTASVTVFTPAPGGGASLARTFTVTSGRGAGFALRFFGHGADDIDRVKIPLEDRPVNIGATDTTIEWWMRANPGENATDACTPGEFNWIFGNSMFDRDIVGPGDFGDWGISLSGGRLAFGVNNGTVGVGICGTTDLADGVWHHVAVTRRLADGQLQIFVDGQLDGGDIGPPGNISYRSGRPTSFPASEPFLVIGAEKHDAGALYPSFRGWIDEVRLSTTLRYTGNFVRPAQPFTPDPETAALYHFDEGAGDQITDSSGAAGGPSDGLRRFGGLPGSPPGPEWVVSDAPLQ